MIPQATNVIVLGMLAFPGPWRGPLSAAEAPEEQAAEQTRFAQKSPDGRRVAPIPEQSGEESWPSQQGQEQQPSPQERLALAKGLNAFALEFYARLKDEPKGNLFCSPYSLWTALAMTHLGAAGNTARELEQVLGFTLGREGQHRACGALLTELNKGAGGAPARGYALAVANRLYGAKGMTFLPEFLAACQRSYGTTLETLDFQGALEASRVAINRWVEGQTQQKIKDLILAGQLTPATTLVLVNAIHFKGDWERSFEKGLTKDEPFHLEGGKPLTVPTMHLLAKFRYREEAGRFQALELPYAKGELSMCLFLPAQETTLADFEGTLTLQRLEQWIQGLAEERVAVALPKFKLEWGTRNVVPELQALGIRDAFRYPGADFSGLDGTRLLYISLVLHKAFVEVHEEGTEAAAATAVVVAPGAAMPGQEAPPKRFQANRPFFFLIRHQASGAILFLGRVHNPVAGK